MSAAPAQRVTILAEAPARAGGDYVLYWMIAARRARFNWGLEHAASWAERLGKPLVVLEALRSDYPWASDRLHRFIIEGMGDNVRAFSGVSVTYYPFVETPRNSGKGLLRALAARACVIVTDEYPCFFLPRMVGHAAKGSDVRFEQVDSNGLSPLRASPKAFTRAYDFRRHLQKTLPASLLPFPRRSALEGLALPRLATASLAPIEARWPRAREEQLRGESGSLLAELPIDHSVGAVSTRGGSERARRVLERFVEVKLARYAAEANQPAEELTSGLSPYLHFGHIGAHEVMDAIFSTEGWSVDRMGGLARGQREGFWGMSPSAEAFVDQLVTWRELGFNCCHHRDDYADVASLPAWALATLRAHESDPREHVYSFEQLEGAETHDPLWNAAQRELLREGRIHNYLRMLWGKKILEWTPDVDTAARVMISLNDKYALDGRDPNSYSGIFWVLGRHDRAWGPERPIFGKVRYMSSQSAMRKLRLKPYLERFG